METDEYRIVKAIIKRLIKEMEPLATIEWDESRAPAYLRFRVEAAGTVLLESSGDWLVSDIAFKKDNEVKALISATSGGKLK